MSKEEYKQYISSYGEKVSIFLHPWYIESLLSPEEWGVAVSKKGNEINGILVYKIEVEKGFKKIKNIPFTPCTNLQMFINPNSKRIGQRKEAREILENIIDDLPKFDDLRLKLSHELEDLRPFYWHGFNESTKYTSVIPHTVEEDFFYNNLKGSIRTEIKKVTNKIDVSYNDNLESVFQIIENTFLKKEKNVPISKDVFMKLSKNALMRDKLHLRNALDKNGNLVGSIYCLEDLGTRYYIFGGFLSNKEYNGCQSYLLYNLIIEGLKSKVNFDFEGSMIKSVDRFFMSFNPEIRKYSLITKTNNRFLKVRNIFK